MTEPQRNWPPEISAWPDKTVVPPKSPTKAHPAMLAGCVLLLISPLAGVIALAATDGWAIPVWLGGWILAIVLMGIGAQRGSP
jgi:hypothetical protein